MIVQTPVAQDYDKVIMRQNLLSDREIEDVFSLSAAGKHTELVDKVNRMIRERSRGDDRCARPLAIRGKDQMLEPCFALGYMDKIIDFIDNTVNRVVIADDAVERKAQNMVEVISDVREYVQNLRKEIRGYFHA